MCYLSLPKNHFQLNLHGRDKKKESAPNYAAYYPFGVDVFLCQRKIPHIARFVELPTMDSFGTLPPILVVNIQVLFLYFHYYIGHWVLCSCQGNMSGLVDNSFLMELCLSQTAFCHELIKCDSKFAMLGIPNDKEISDLWTFRSWSLEMEQMRHIMEP